MLNIYVIQHCRSLKFKKKKYLKLCFERKINENLLIKIKFHDSLNTKYIKNISRSVLTCRPYFFIIIYAFILKTEATKHRRKKNNNAFKYETGNGAYAGE